jgi:hypothetical protein
MKTVRRMAGQMVRHWVEQMGFQLDVSLDPMWVNCSVGQTDLQ